MNIDFEGGIRDALREQAWRDGEFPPSQLEIDEWLTGLGGPLLPLTPPPDSSLDTTTSTPMPQSYTTLSEFSHPSVDEVLQRASDTLQELAFQKPTCTPQQTLKKNRKKRHRQKQKAERAPCPHDAFSYKVRPGLSRKFGALQVLRCDMDAHNLPACAGAWKGKYEKEGVHCLTLQEALGMGLRLIQWDGK